MIGGSAFADNDTKLVLDMGILQIETNYDVHNTIVSYEESCNKVVAIIRDRETFKIIDKYEQLVIEDPLTQEINILRSGYLTVPLRREYNPTSSNTTTITALIETKLYKETILGQVVYTLIDVNDYDHYLSGSKPFELENKYTSIQKQTSSYCDLNITGTMKATKQQATSAGLSFEFLDGLGFGMSGESTSPWHARLAYNGSVRITVD
ncbi:hypothetical protein [Maledivibacter halophilus]|nr:hypothetical protein [Maledivibacter halophilus]